MHAVSLFIRCVVELEHCVALYLASSTRTARTEVLQFKNRKNLHISVKERIVTISKTFQQTKPIYFKPSATEELYTLLKCIQSLVVIREADITCTIAWGSKMLFNWLYWIMFLVEMILCSIKLLQYYPENLLVFS